jgi:hypothetical protein
MISSAAEAEQASADFDEPVLDVGEITSDSDSHTSFFNRKSKDSELAVVPRHVRNVEMTSQRTREPYDRMDKSIHTTLVAPSEQVAEVGETGSTVISRFEEILASLRAVALTREEAQKVENLLWDVKGELYAAEKRGRVEG